MNCPSPRLIGYNFVVDLIRPDCRTGLRATAINDKHKAMILGENAKRFYNL